MKIYLITTSYSSQIYFIITSYMKYRWLWCRILDTGESISRDHIHDCKTSNFLKVRFQLYSPARPSHATLCHSQSTAYRVPSLASTLHIPAYLRLQFTLSFQYTGCCKTSGQLWKPVTDAFFEVFLMFLGSFDCQLWAIFHFGTLNA